MTRKLFRGGQGKKSLLMTVPPIWAKAVGVNAGDEIVLELCGDCLKVYPKKEVSTIENKDNIGSRIKMDDPTDE